MKNKLTDLNNVLFEALERIQDDSLTPEQLDVEIRRGNAVKDIARVVIDNGRLALDTMKTMNEYGYGSKDGGAAPVPQMLDC